MASAAISSAGTSGVPPPRSVPRLRVNCVIANRWRMPPTSGSFSMSRRATPRPDGVWNQR